MTSPGLHPGARPVAAACFQQTRHRLASVRQPEQRLAGLHGFRRETRLQRQARRQVLQALRD